MHRWLVGLAIALAVTALTPAPALAAPPPYYPPLNWLPAAAGNYSAGRSAQIRAIVIHETDGSYSSAINWFRRPGSKASAHYLVRAWDGEITQLVAETDTAYHARDANPWTIGIEHEFYVRQGILHTEAQYRSSALLVCAIARRYNIPIDRDHIVGHRELPNQFHGDPGPLWDWPHYMYLVRNCAGGAAADEGRVTASSVETCAEPGCTPAAGLEFGDEGQDVALLQWALAYLGFMEDETVAGGGGAFGPRTLDGVLAFQEAKDLPVTGYYGEMTAAALSETLARDPVSTPNAPLAQGTTSPDVAKLQISLRKLGYMDLVTGMYGPITREAVLQFQQDFGIVATGTYGAITRMALATQTR